MNKNADGVRASDSCRHNINGNHPCPRSHSDDETQSTSLQYSIYEELDLVQLFGPQYGIPQSVRSKKTSNFTYPTEAHVQISNPYEPLIQQADTDFQQTYKNSLKTEKIEIGAGTKEPDQDKSTLIQRGQATSCVVCTEEFSSTIQTPPWISLACLHQPSVCTGCLAQSIRHDLDNKVWDQIKCPECSITLIYEDIQRLADPEIFLRYETLSFRNAVGADANFIWCRNCDFGQLHESGSAQPIIRCLNCGFRSCFRHSVPWHERLTCEEYDEMLRDPDGFRSAVDKDDEASEEVARLQYEEDE